MKNESRGSQSHQQERCRLHCCRSESSTLLRGRKISSMQIVGQSGNTTVRSLPLSDQYRTHFPSLCSLVSRTFTQECKQQRLSQSEGLSFRNFLFFFFFFTEQSNLICKDKYGTTSLGLKLNWSSSKVQ